MWSQPLILNLILHSANQSFPIPHSAIQSFCHSLLCHSIIFFSAIQSFCHSLCCHSFIPPFSILLCVHTPAECAITCTYHLWRWGVCTTSLKAHSEACSMIMMQRTVTSSTSVETKTADSVHFSSNYKCMIAYIYNDTLKMYVHV